MKTLSTLLFALVFFPTLSFAKIWTEENILDFKLETVICNETPDDGGLGGYFVSFPKDPITTYMIIGVDKSDDTEHLIGGYDIRSETEVKVVKRDKKVDGEWKVVSVKVFSIQSVMSKVETQIDLAPMLNVLNSSKPKEKTFPAVLIIPTGNIYDFGMSCEIRG